MDLREAIIPAHAADQMRRRQVSEANLRTVLATPEAVLPQRPGRVVIHGMISGYLLRVFVDVDRTPAEVVTVYRTSKLEKYRSRP
jgi:hypothetical protein